MPAPLFIEYQAFVVTRAEHLAASDDDMVLEAAVNGQADAIVTFNRRDFRPVTEQFGIDVISRGGAIERLGDQ